MNEEPSPLHEGIFFVLPYLHLSDLLSVARVCKSLKDAVRDDIVPGQKLVVVEPLSYRLTDDRLAELAAKSEGRVQVLALINCHIISDDALLRFVLSNPEITELHVPFCASLTPEGVIKVAKHLKLKKLRIDGVYHLNKDHLETLHELMTSSSKRNLGEENRIFYHVYSKADLPQLDDRAIDVEVCPKCGKGRVVFDCPRLSCKDECRSCQYCTSRCIECGLCFPRSELEVRCCGDLMCRPCRIAFPPRCSLCKLAYCKWHRYSYAGRDSAVVDCPECHGYAK